MHWTHHTRRRRPSRGLFRFAVIACAIVAGSALKPPRAIAAEAAQHPAGGSEFLAAGEDGSKEDLCSSYVDKMRGRIEGLKKLREALEKSEKGPSGNLTGLLSGAPKVDERLRKKITRSRSWLNQLKHAGAALGCDDIDIEKELASPPGAALSPWRPRKVERKN